MAIQQPLLFNAIVTLSKKIKIMNCYQIIKAIEVLGKT